MSLSPTADACSGMASSANEWFVGNGVIPVNARGVLWWYRNGDDTWESASDPDWAELLEVEPSSANHLLEKLTMSRWKG